MEGYFSQNQIGELSMTIDRLHLSYLNMEESPEKLDHRAKLEDAIVEFLSAVGHNQKFLLRETEEVLYRSAAHKKGFSGYKAATGWNALQVYAGNLLVQPWRREYRQIKTYCGFYKHQIEANLLGAERMFESMGYRHIGNGILALEGPVCPDEVANVSRDCLVAYVECQILKHIWEEVSILANISWLDILEYRRSYSGNPDQCIRNLKYRFRPETVKEQDVFHPTSPSTQLGIPPAYNYVNSPTHHRHTVPVQQVPLCCPAAYVPYGYVPCSAHIPIVNQPVHQPMVPNGYFYGNTVPPMAPMYSVPTGQLIELDGRNDFDTVDGASGWKNRRSRTNSAVTVEPDVLRNGDMVKNGFEHVSEDKHAAGNDWDYVYRDLEKQGYSKDLGERGDVLANATDKQRKYTREPRKMKITNLDEAMNNLAIADRPLKITEALEKMEQKSVEKVTTPRERRHSHGSFYENVSSSETATKPSNLKPTQSSSVQSKTLPKEKPEKHNPIIANAAESTIVKEKPSVAKWECKSCTYLNNMSKDICEICSKSRKISQDKPIEVGGAECSKCTLVNPKSAKICQACGCSLKDSPTYI